MKYLGVKTTQHYRATAVCFDANGRGVETKHVTGVFTGQNFDNHVNKKIEDVSCDPNAPPSLSSDAGEFVQGQSGDVTCPTGSYPITDAKECEKAAKYFVLPYFTGNWRGSPKGCGRTISDERGIFFNQNDTGSSHGGQTTVCRSGEFVQGQSGMLH